MLSLHLKIKIGFVLCLALSVLPSYAATITVDTNADDTTINNNCTLREAVASANANAIIDNCIAGTLGGDTIDFAAGLNGSLIILGSQIDISQELIIDASVLASGITIDGDGAGNTGIRRVFGVTEDEKLTLNNLVVTNGLTTGDNNYSDPFDPLDCESSATDSTQGGAICTEGDLVLINTTISNSSTTGRGATGGGFHTAETATLSNSIVSGNSTAGDGATGGGFTSTSAATLSNSIVSGNSTAGDFSRGGGFSASTATLINSTVSDNGTTGENSNGGGFVAGDFSATLTNSTVSGNSTTGVNAHGGGFITGHAILNNSTITNNVATNASSNGDGIFIVSSITITSTILSGNGDDNYAGPALNATNSLFGDNVSELVTGVSNVLNNVPGLVPLADNGCNTPVGTTTVCVPTHALLLSSPALDTGSNTLSLITDERGSGFPRVLNGQADIGAFEGFAVAAQPASIPTLNIWLLALLSLMLGFLVQIKGRFRS